MRWVGHVERMGQRRGVYTVLVGKPEGKRPLERPRHRWEYNIKMDLQEVGCGGMDWIELGQGRDGWLLLVNVVMNLWVPLNTENFVTGWKTVGFSRRTLLHGISKYATIAMVLGLRDGWLSHWHNVASGTSTGGTVIVPWQFRRTELLMPIMARTGNMFGVKDGYFWLLSVVK